MNRGEGAWDILGIAPTDDARAIRSAYATRLKTIDPEVDPQAFIQLRAAFEAVRGQGAWQVEPAAEAIDPLPPVAEPPGPAPEARPTKAEDEAEMHAREIYRLLYGHDGHDPWLTTDAQAAMIDHWHAIAGDPRMEEIRFRDRIERWAAVIIAQTSPLSAPILMLAAEQFGWIDADRAARTGPHVAEIARRYRMLCLLHAATKPGNRYNAAWKELTTPADPFSSHGRVDSFAVFEVLAAMRYALPELESTFDPLRVSSWEEHVRSGYVMVVREWTAGGCLRELLLGGLIMIAFGVVGAVLSLFIPFIVGFFK